MEDNKNNSSNDKYRDFFEREDNEARKRDDKQTHTEEESTASTSYYRYGPFHSTFNEEESSQTDTSLAPSESETRAQVTEKTPSVAINQNRMAPVTKSVRTKSPVTRMFASFMAGVIVVGSLMFTSDRMDWFTGDQVLSEVASSAVNSEPSSSSNGVQKAALDLLRPNNISQIVANSQGSVVKIETYSKVNQSRQMDNDIFNYFFGGQGGSNEDSPSDEGTLRQSGMGSGFIFDSSGYILTNQHVIDGASEIKVYVEGYDEPFVAKKLGESHDLDLAALKIEGDKPFATLNIGNADELNVGEWVVAIGNPYGYDHTVTVGVLSAKERPITIPDANGTREYQHLLQTDASINPGNSGGPLLNLNGEVIGINTAVNAEAQGIGFAIPTGTFIEVLDNLKNNKPIPVEPAPYIGVSLADLNDTIAKQLGFKGTKGALINQVEVGSPAHQAGIQAGDIITTVSDKSIESSADVVAIIKDKKVGDKVKIKVFRDGKNYEVSTIVGDRNAESNE
ncbi:MAG: trypsin-like peptidase domain-containing protein [Paenibacillaceae bacterium]